MGRRFNLDGALGETLGLSSPANLIRATFVVESAVMNLKSAEVQSKDKRLFVQESKQVIDLNQVEKKLTAVSEWPCRSPRTIYEGRPGFQQRGGGVPEFVD
jgi:hypothetical protein